MKLPLLLILSFTFWSCQSRNPSVSSANVSPDPKPQVPQTDAGGVPVIVLDAIQQQKAHVAVEQIRARQVHASLIIPGSLEVNEDQTWRVGAIASGRMDGISARVGDAVTAGQVLALLHSHEVHEARAGYQEAATELARAQAAEEFAKQRRDRAQRLLELKAGSRQDLETAEADLRNAQAAIQKAESEVEKERAHLNIFHVPPEDPASNHPQAEEEDDIPIPAPASGLVFERKATVGSVVNSGEELFAIIDTSSLWMIASANEADLSRLHVGQAVRIQVRAYPEREFPGRILQLGEKLDPDTRTLQIRILVPNPQGRLKPEMYATATLQGSEHRAAVLVPEEAIQDVNGVSVVFVRSTPNQFEARPVKTGEHSEGETEILEGLKSGESVVVKGSFLLKSQILKSAIQEN
jgi:membrane fusion protein, heavy metal efflux system